MTEIELTPERRDALINRLQTQFQVEFDEPLSTFRAAALLDLVLKWAGPPIYNQAVQDVRAHLQRRLDDLHGEIFAPPAY